LFADNSAACWGGDYEGELGDGKVHIDHDDSPKTVVVPDDTGKPVALIFGGGQLAAGQYHTCGLISSSPANSVGCWGANGHGQLGDNTLSVRSIAVAANDEGGPITNAIGLSEGYATTCALLSDTTPRCWGSDEDNELGRGAAGSNQFTGITIINTDGFPLGGILQVASGANHECGLSVDGNVYCWGINSAHELGPNASGGNSDLPVAVTIDAPIFFDNFDDD
jgi:alpha-tubulin suppressor-like RCC1 family protein